MLAWIKPMALNRFGRLLSLIGGLNVRLLRA